MNKFKKGDRVVLKNASGVSLYIIKDSRILDPILPGHLGTVTCAYDGRVTVRFDGDDEYSQRLLEERFELVVPEVSIPKKVSKKVFYPCSHDYQELEDDVMSLCFEFGKNVFYKE